MTLTSYILRRYLGEMSIPFMEKHFFYGKELILNYEEIHNILKDGKCQFLKYFYFNKENVHDILYQENKIISIDNNNKIAKTLNELFYLDLLIMDRPNFINYIFSKDIIIFSCEELLKIRKGPKRIVFAKIIYDLIENFKGFGTFDEKINENSLTKLSNLCIKEIKNEIKNEQDFWSDIDACNLLTMSIDKLYSKIIIKLFKSDFISNDYVFNIFNDLELESIKINENIYTELINFLNSDEIYQNIILIETIEDLFNIKKINFYYILLKYILKNSFYIYQTDFLTKARESIISFIKNNLYSLLIIATDLDKNTKEKLDFVIKALTDTDYFYLKYTKMKNDARINFLLGNKRLKYAFPLIQILADLKIENMKLDEEEINNIIKNWDVFYDIIKEAKFKKLPLYRRKKLFAYLKDENNKILLLNLFNKKQYNLFQQLDIDYSEEFIEIKSSNDINLIQINDNQSNNLIVDKIDSQYSEQNNYKPESTSIIVESYTIENVIESQVEYDIERLDINSIEFDFDMFTKSNKFKILEYNKILEKNEKFNRAYLHYAKNISKGHYIIAGNIHKIMIYNSYFEKKLEMDLNLIPKNIYEIENNNKNKYEIKLIACCGKELILITIDLLNYSYNIITKSKHKDIYYSVFVNLGDKYLISGLKGVFLLNENKNYQRENKILETNYINSIHIKEKIFAFTSNDLLPNGENELIIYNFKKNEIMKEISNYPFKISNNGLYLINLKTIKSINIDRQILFSSCVSMQCDKNGKNGILFVDINLEKNIFFEAFHKTKEFEPHCFCQISIVDNHNSINDDIAKEKNIFVQDTEYFLVGGFEPMKRMGCVKLYKIKYNKKSDKINIKYLLDITTENVEQFKGFDMDVTCITQSKITGNILINCLDGNTYLFKPPNLELFLRN